LDFVSGRAGFPDLHDGDHAVLGLDVVAGRSAGATTTATPAAAGHAVAARVVVLVVVLVLVGRRCGDLVVRFRLVRTLAPAPTAAATATAVPAGAVLVLVLVVGGGLRLINGFRGGLGSGGVRGGAPAITPAAPGGRDLVVA